MTDHHQPEQVTNEKKFIIPERKKLKHYNTDLFQLQLYNNFD